MYLFVEKQHVRAGKEHLYENNITYLLVHLSSPTIGLVWFNPL